MSALVTCIERIKLNDESIQQVFLELVFLRRRVQAEGRTEETFLEICRLDNLTTFLKEKREAILHEYHQSLLVSSQEI
jgi:hypothetical protein